MSVPPNRGIELMDEGRRGCTGHSCSALSKRVVGTIPKTQLCLEHVNSSCKRIWSLSEQVRWDWLSGVKTAG